jgi:hypothetical protein
LIVLKGGNEMKKRRDQKQEQPVNLKQLPLPGLGFVATVEVEKPHFDPPPRWPATPDHVFGKQVAAVHPRFEGCVLEVEDRDNGFVTARWPKGGGPFVFNVKTGKVIYRRRFEWVLSPEDIAWFRENPLPGSAKKSKPALQVIMPGLESQAADRPYAESPDGHG